MIDAENIKSLVGQLESYIAHYEMVCNTFELKKSGLANHVKTKRDEMLKQSREELKQLLELALDGIKWREVKDLELSGYPAILVKDYRND